MLCFAVISLFVSWLFCQSFKMWTNWRNEGDKFALKKLSQDGSFPSAHSSVMAVQFLVCLIAYVSNRNSENSDIYILLLLISFSLGAVVVRDAVGVRYTVQMLSEAISKSGLTIDEKYMRYITAKNGHQKHEVLGGILCGFMGTLATYSVWTHKYLMLLWEVPVVLVFSLLSFYHRKLLKKK